MSTRRRPAPLKVVGAPADEEQVERPEPIDGAVDRLVAVCSAAALPPVLPAGDVESVLAEVRAEIAPWRLPAELERFWRLVDPESIAIAPYPRPTSPAFALHCWQQHRDSSPGMTPRLLFPFAYQSHGFLFVELEDGRGSGGAVLEWGLRGLPLRRALPGRHGLPRPARDDDRARRARAVRRRHLHPVRPRRPMEGRARRPPGRRTSTSRRRRRRRARRERAELAGALAPRRRADGRVPNSSRRDRSARSSSSTSWCDRTPSHPSTGLPSTARPRRARWSATWGAPRPRAPICTRRRSTPWRLRKHRRFDRSPECGPSQPARGRFDRRRAGSPSGGPGRSSPQGTGKAHASRISTPASRDATRRCPGRDSAAGTRRCRRLSACGGVRQLARRWRAVRRLRARRSSSERPPQTPAS